MQIFGYEFKKFIAEGLKDLHFKDFSPIQKEVFNNLKLNKNIIAKSKTGSGKTHAYLIPIFNDIDPNLKKIQAVIITPTIELARQVNKVALHLASFSPDTIVVKAFYGGTDTLKEIEKLESNPPQIVIATPPKLEDLVIKQNVLKIHEAKYLILDEADMVTDSFLDNIINLWSPLEKAKKMFFSATFKDETLASIKKFISNSIFIEPTLKEDNKLNIKHYLIAAKHDNHLDMLLKLTDIINPYLCIIFANKKTEVDEIYPLLKEKGLNIIALHGDIDLRARKRIVNEINALKYQYVIATDMLARGIDIYGVSDIINYNLPKDFEFYIHRSGRTARMDMDGVCYSLYDLDNDEYLNNLEKRGITFEYLTIKNKELIPYKERNSCDQRLKPATEIEVKVKKMLGKKGSVKPGYKKKYQEETKKIMKKMRKR